MDGPRATTTVQTLPEADDILRLWAQSAPERGKGYHRVAYLLAFENGQEYREIYHLYRSDVRPVDLARPEPTGGGRRQVVLRTHRDRQTARKRAAALLDSYALD